MDTLSVSNLAVFTFIGVYEWEQRIKQRLLLDISIPLDSSKINNNLKNTIDYDALCKSVTQLIESNSFTLIETVAEVVAQHIKETFHIDKLTLKVSKPEAIKNAANVSITIHR
ncbi:dihydroneopterin aldolase (plasmid) [Legionella adelaidensis]|uniref:7,8-dihydroneopterin aldolase n=1 Tax=Legionella adelaidensis TaxID=45056 RepID=A0A0W0R5Z1_9GAMM|nr:dihydroneopterin aldolase [Legionella adelaidensis]KTC66499.1 dihydroneopterin aldolase FolB [Legionella adelaidensis]VEH85804.1 dihydroneopterin aldolase [Legionella adelaidensis]